MSQAQVNAITAELNGFVSKLTAKIALDVTANLVKTTPVDTGWARANWVPNIGSPAGPTQPDGGPEDSDVRSAAFSQSAGQAQLLGYSIQFGKIYIASGVPYIERLNAGSSQQAPAGFVERAVEKAVRQDILSIGI